MKGVSFDIEERALLRAGAGVENKDFHLHVFGRPSEFRKPCYHEGHEGTRRENKSETEKNRKVSDCFSRTGATTFLCGPSALCA